MKKLFFFLIGVLVVFALVTISIGGYLGFVPMLAGVFGADQPEDLGVVTSQAAFDQYASKAQATYESLPQPVDGKTAVFSDPQPMTVSFTQEEVSSALANTSWPYMLIANPQVRINPDGSVEASGVVRLDRLEGFLAQVGGPGYTRADAEKGLEWLGLLPTNPIVYAKGTGSVTNNQAKVDVDTITVGRLPIPFEKLGGDAVLTSIANHIISSVDGLNVEQADFANSQLNFTGTAPTKIQVLEK